MKTIIFGMLISTLATSAFSQEMSAFERGFAEGAKTCGVVQQLWQCTATCSDYHFRVSKIGASRAEALQNLYLHEYKGAKICVEEVVSSQTTCSKI